jgi:type IV secretory pathway ATPase VirB11/archaellum biosynthesis ATPase
VETIAVYPVKQAPDGPLERIRGALEDEGFAVSAADELDLAARRGPDRLFVGLGAEPEGLAARWKAKSLVPGRTSEVHRIAERVLGEVLGEPLRVRETGEAGR